MKLLQIDSSILGDNSVSRILSAGIVTRQLDLHPGIEVTYRDLAAAPLAHLSGAHLGAWHGAVPEDSATKADVASGDAALAELFAADIIVIGAPMYNFAIPTALKAWIDRLLIAGRSFQYTEHGPKSLLPPGKKLFIASARGGVYTPGSPAAPLDHQETYLQGVFSFLGITDVTVIRAEGIAMGPEVREQALAGARAQIDALAA